MDKYDGFRIRMYTHKELLRLYGCSHKTMDSWVSPFRGEIGPLVGRAYTPRQVKVIVEKLGLPESLPDS